MKKSKSRKELAFDAYIGAKMDADGNVVDFGINGTDLQLYQLLQVTILTLADRIKMPDEDLIRWLTKDVEAIRKAELEKRQIDLLPTVDFVTQLPWDAGEGCIYYVLQRGQRYICKKRYKTKLDYYAAEHRRIEETDDDGTVMMAHKKGWDVEYAQWKPYE